MNKWYLCTVAYERQGDEMGLRKVSESYLVDALSFTEAEERVIKEVTPLVSFGALEVANIRPMRLSELLLDERGNGKYYRARVGFVEINQATGQERSVNTAMVVQADTLKEAVAKLVDYLDEGRTSYEVIGIAELDILDVYRYIAPEEQ